MIGWVKLHRKILGSNMYRSLNSKQRDVMIAILLSVNFEENEWEWEGQVYRCMPGQCITSLQKIAELCGSDVKVQSVRTALLKLEKWGFLTNVSTKTGRLITIVNWHRYQSQENETNKGDNKELTKDQQRANKELTTNKEIEEGEEGKETNILDPEAGSSEGSDGNSDIDNVYHTPGDTMLSRENGIQGDGNHRDQLDNNQGESGANSSPGGTSQGNSTTDGRVDEGQKRQVEGIGGESKCGDGTGDQRSSHGEIHGDCKRQDQGDERLPDKLDDERGQRLGGGLQSSQKREGCDNAMGTNPWQAPIVPGSTGGRQDQDDGAEKGNSSDNSGTETASSDGFGGQTGDPRIKCQTCGNQGSPGKYPESDLGPGDGRPSDNQAAKQGQIRTEQDDRDTGGKGLLSGITAGQPDDHVDGRDQRVGGEGCRSGEGLPDATKLADANDNSSRSNGKPRSVVCDGDQGRRIDAARNKDLPGKPKKDKPASRFTTKDARQMRPEWWTIEEWDELIVHRQKKKAVLSRRAFNGLLTEFELSRKRGYTAAEILDAMSSGKGWAGYKDEWVTKPPKRKNGNNVLSLEEKKKARGKECQRCEVMHYEGKCKYTTTLLGQRCKGFYEYNGGTTDRGMLSQA